MDLKTYKYKMHPGKFGLLALNDRAFRTFAFFLLLLLSSEVRSQDVVYWSGSSPNGNWEWGSLCTAAGVDGNWHYTTNGFGERKRPDCFATPNTVYFDNTNYPVMNLNSPDDYTLNQILFVSVTNGRTFNTDASRSIWFKQNGVNNAKIENYVALTTHTFNVEINVDAGTNMEFNPVNGFLAFNNTIYNRSGNTFNVYGAQQVTFSGDITTTTGSPGITINNTATVVYTGVSKTYSGPTTINSGTTLRISSNQSLGDIVLNNGGTLLVDAGTTLTINGNWTGGGTIDNNGTIILAGSSAQSFPGSSGTVSAMNNLTINNASGVTLDQSMNVDGTLTLSSGTLTLGNNNLTLGASSPAIAGTLSAANMIVTDGTGQLRKVFTAAGSYVFPVGDASGTTDYSPITLNFTSGTFTGAYAAVRVINAKHPNNASTNNFLSRYWALSGSGMSGYSCNINAEFPATDITGSAANMSVGRWGGSMPWVKGGTVTATTLSVSGLTALGEITGLGAAPTVTISANPSLTVCQNSGVTLTANASGDPGFTYSWNPGGATTQSIDPGTSVVGSTLYTVTVTDINGSSNSANATVVVNATPAAPTGSATQTFCSGTFPTIASLSATGTNIQWYDVPGGGTALPASTALVTATYYASQTVNGCESTNRLAVAVIVNPTPAAPTGDATQFFCSSPVPKVSNLTATGTNIKWYNAVSGGTLLTAGTNLVTSTDYYASQTVDGCESTFRLKVRVTIITTPPATTAITGSASPCPATSLIYSVTAKTGTTFTWSIPDDWTAVSALSGFGVNSITVISGAAGSSGTIKVVAVNTCLTDSSLLSVTVITPPAVSINANYCVGGGNIQLTALPGSSPTYSYQWTRNGTNYSTNQAITVNIAAIYSVKVTEASTTCFATATTTLSTELVKNGKFDLGNQYFSSDYTYQPYVTGDTSLHYPEGKYAIGNDPQKYHRDFHGRDHTSNAGNFMIINGVPKSVVWGQQIDSLVPGTKYYFSDRKSVV